MSVAATELKSVRDSPYANLFFKDEEGKIGSVYHEGFKTLGWNGLTEKPLNRTHCDGSNKLIIATYKPEVSFDFMVHTSLEIKLHKLKLKPEFIGKYRFRYVDDLEYKISPSAVLRTDKVLISNLDTYSQLVLNTKLTHSGHNNNISKTLTEWSYDFIKDDEIYPIQKWYYGNHPGKAFPLYRLENPSDVYHVYDFDLRTYRLIIVQNFDESILEWKEVDNKKLEGMNLFENSDKIGMLEIPTMYGMFSNMTDEERAERKDLNTFYIEDMINCDPPESSKLKPDSVTSRTTDMCVGLVQAFFWSAENITYGDYNITCNYTIDKYPTRDSKAAIKSSTMIVNSMSKFENLPSKLFEGPIGTKHFYQTSKRKGIMGFPLVQEFDRGNNGGSCPQKNGTKLAFTLESCPSKEYRFVVRMRALSVKKMIIDEKGNLSIEPF